MAPQAAVNPRSIKALTPVDPPVTSVQQSSCVARLASSWQKSINTLKLNKETHKAPKTLGITSDPTVSRAYQASRSSRHIKAGKSTARLCVAAACAARGAVPSPAPGHSHVAARPWPLAHGAVHASLPAPQSPKDPDQLDTQPLPSTHVLLYSSEPTQRAGAQIEPVHHGLLARLA